MDSMETRMPCSGTASRLPHGGLSPPPPPNESRHYRMAERAVLVPPACPYERAVDSEK
ncbi:MAG TPA: hypothetical protein PKM50_03155 [Methanoregula sp.]|nr:hypothetical protein [Methanoregula sp.]